MKYDAIMLISYGGPEGPDDVWPFLENVLHGKNVPVQRKEEVAKHYYHFNGVSPINQQNRELIASLNRTIQGRGINLPIYFGNRNWKPYIKETMQQMERDGIRRFIALITSPYDSYSGCDQYLENLREAQWEMGENAPQFEKVPAWYNHPNWIQANMIRYEEALSCFPSREQKNIQVAFTAHSIPLEMPKCEMYVQQLKQVCSEIAEAGNISQWALLYQSRSGPAEQSWLEPDIGDYLSEKRPPNLIISPIGFISDHLEVRYDLDIEAAQLCKRYNVRMERAATVGTHPLFIEMLCEYIRMM